MGGIIEPTPPLSVPPLKEKFVFDGLNLDPMAVVGILFFVADTVL